MEQPNIPELAERLTDAHAELATRTHEAQATIAVVVPPKPPRISGAERRRQRFAAAVASTRARRRGELAEPSVARTPRGRQGVAHAAREHAER